MSFNKTKKGTTKFAKIFAMPFLITLCFLLSAQLSYAQPANDDPCNAIPLTVGNNNCTFQQFTNEAATNTAGVTPPGCASYQGADVWFSVVVPAGGALIFDTQQGVVTDGGMAIYRGTCDNLVLIECDDDDSPNGLMPRIMRFDLIATETIWVRFWEYGGNNNGTFNICVTTPPPPPSNDDPCNAISLTVGNAVCNYTQFTNAFAGNSTGVPAPGCANYQGGDVWFTVTVPAGGALNFNTQQGVVTDAGMAIYSGSCDNLNLIDCDDDDSQNGLMPMIMSTGLTPGATIWIRVWENGNNNNGTFGICVNTPPPAPGNDDPCGAININAAYTCNYTMYSNEGSTTTTGAPVPGCATFTTPAASKPDVWFKVVVPCEGKLIFDTQTGSITDGGMAIYRGTCDNLTLIECDDDDSQNGLMPRIVRNDLISGETIWVRFWQYSGGTGTFGLCITVPPPSQPSSNCTTAQSFCTSAFPDTVMNVTGVPSLGQVDCLFTTPNPTFYYLQIQTAGDINIQITQFTSAGVPIDVDFIVWGPFNDLASVCGPAGGLDVNGPVVDCSYSAAPVEDAFIPNAQIGEYYLFLVTNYNGQAGYIVYQQTAGTGSSNCNIVCQLDGSNDGPVCPGGSVNLFVTDVPGATYSWTGPNCFTSTQQNPTTVFPPSIPGQYVYFVTANAPNGTICYDTTLVTVLTPPDLGLDSTVQICAGSTTDLTTIYNTTGLTTTWTFGGGPVSNPTAVSEAGIYQLSVINSSGCVDTAIVTVETFLITIGQDTTLNICEGGSANLTSVYNTTGFTTAWTFGGNTVTTPDAVTAAGIYQLIAENALGCADTVNVTVAIDVVSATAASTNANCTDNGVASVNTPLGFTPFTYAISTAPTDFVPTPDFSVPQGTYTITVKDSLGCVKDIPVTVGFTNNMLLSAIGDTSICNGAQPVTLTASGNAASYSWSPTEGLNDPASATPQFTPTASGTYTFTVTGTLGLCTLNENVTVNVFNGVSVNIIQSALELVHGEQTFIQATAGANAVSFAWTPPISLSSATVLSPLITGDVIGVTTYTLTATDADGCKSSDNIIVNIIPYCIKVANAFTPNGDGINDLWTVYDNIECLKNVQVSIFNRYGAKVYENKNYQNNWNGTYKGKPVPDATYYAVLQFSLVNGRVFTVKTDLTIMR